MDPTAFWIAFFQSHYYHRDRVSQGGDDNNDLFADCVKLDEKGECKVNLCDDIPLLDSYYIASVFKSLISNN